MKLTTDKKAEKQQRGRPPISETTEQLVMRLYEEDKMTCQEIAKACQISTSTLHRIIRKHKEVEVRQ